MRKETHGVMRWRSNTPQLLEEIVTGSPTGWALRLPVNILKTILTELAERAIAIDDPELNILMLRLALYDVHPLETSDAIKEQEARIPD